MNGSGGSREGSLASACLRPHLLSRADDESSEPVNTNVVLRYDGLIIWDSPAITKSSCVVDVTYFPFDSQQCNLTFGSWTYNGNQVDLFNALDSGDLSDFIEDVEWEVHGMPAVKNVISYGCCSEPYPDVTFTLLLKRRSSFYIVNLLIPCVLISFLAPLSFYLPAASGEKVSLGVTILLAMTVFQLMVAEIMPASENVPLIGECIYLALWRLGRCACFKQNQLAECFHKIHSAPADGIFACRYGCWHQMVLAISRFTKEHLFILWLSNFGF